MKKNLRRRRRLSLLSQPSNGPSSGVRQVLLGTLLLAIAFEGTAFLASRIWVTPDSTAYISLAVGLADRFDFSQPLFQLRLPGYPLLLAGLFRAFGNHSAIALLAVQHAMVVGCALFAVLIAWTLWPCRIFAGFAGVACGLSLHLSGYAGAVLTEVPYAFMLTGCMYFLLRFTIDHGYRFLLTASLLGGLAALIKDVGQYAIVTCALVAVVCAWRGRRGVPGEDEDETEDEAAAVAEAEEVRASNRAWLRRLLRSGGGVAYAVLPAMAIMSPFMIHNYATWGRIKANANGGLLYYYRAGYLDKLDSHTSEAVAYLRDTVATARENGWVPDGATHHDYLATVHACERIRGHEGSIFESGHLAEIGAIMRRAGIDLICEHPGAVARSVLRDIYHILLIPDDGYRMLPGGAFSGNRLAPEDPIHAVDTYLSSVTDKIGNGALRKYLPITNTPRPMTAAWSAFVRQYHHKIEKGSMPLFVVDTPYEASIALAGLGMVASLFLKRRLGFAVLAFVVFYHAAGSAFMGGVQPRYLVPVHPLLNIFACVPVAMLWVGLVRSTPALRRHLATTVSKTSNNCATTS